MKEFSKTMMMAIIMQFSWIVQCEEWQTVIEDTFKASPPSRIAGSNLSGFAVEKGGCIWRQHGIAAIFQLSSGGNVSNGNINGGKTIALVDCIPTGDYKIKIEADLRPGKSQWVALGFSGSDDFFWSKDGQLWLTIRGSRENDEGQVVVYTNGTKTMLKSAKGENYGFSLEKSSHVEIIYDKPANTATVTVNGKSILDNHPLKDYKPEIKTAGVMTNLPEPNDPGMVDNFKISLKGGSLQAPVADAAKGKAAK